MPTKDPERRRISAAIRMRRWRRNNPEQARANYKKWRFQNPEKARSIDAKSKRKRTLRRRAWLDLQKNKPCVDCRGIFLPCAMDFDHVRGKKTRGVALMRLNSFQTILNEIAKCELVCANCHRIRTWRRLQKTIGESNGD